MKRTLAAVGVPAVAAIVLLGGAPAASAHEQHPGHHHGHHDTRSAAPLPRAAERGTHHRGRVRHHQGDAAGCHHTCTPAPTPPPGGWPCQAAHSCKPPKVPHCRPPKHHHHRPVVHPRPPIVHPPVKTPHSHVGGHKRTHAHPAPPANTGQLALTGPSDYAAIGGAATSFLVAGGALLLLTRRPRRQTKAIEAALDNTATS